MLFALARRILSHRFFARSDEEASVWRTIRWWEMRRIPYNLLVGAAGIVSLLVLVVCELVVENVQHVSAGPMPDPPLFLLAGIFFYGVAANLCYTSGWVVELFARRIWGPATGALGPITFALGLGFSVLLSLLPGMFVIAVTVAGLIVGPQFWANI
jgi:hypothetical protein